VLGHERWLDAANQLGQPRQRARIDRLGAGQRERDAVQRQRMLAPDRVEPGEARSAGDEIVLGVNLEPEAGGAAGEGVAEMLGLEAEAGRQINHAGATPKPRLKPSSASTSPCPSAS
jgi:hypothetical protein